MNLHHIKVTPGSPLPPPPPSRGVTIELGSARAKDLYVALQIYQQQWKGWSPETPDLSVLLHELGQAITL